MKRFFIFSLLILWMSSLGLWIDSQAFGYEETEVSNGGTLIGKVDLKGPIPPPRLFRLDLSPFSGFCEKISDGEGHVILDDFYVGPEGGLQGTVVAVQGVEKGIPFHPMKPEWSAIDCLFKPADLPLSELYDLSGQGSVIHIHPPISILQNHQAISVVNKDPVFHNGQIFQSERGNIMINFTLPISGEPDGGILDFDPGKRIAKMICGMHEFMQAWGFAVDNPYYALTDENGRFSIDHLPPGTYEVLAWHPNLKPIQKEVTVPIKKTVDLNFEFDGGQVKRRVFESEKGVRSFD